MDQIPTVLSVLEGADAAGLTADGLTFAITDNDGLNIAYLVQLPAGTVNGQLLTQQILGQAGLLLETKPAILSNLVEGGDSNSQVVTENNNDTSTNNNTVGSLSEPMILGDTSSASSSGGMSLSADTLGLQPIQIQFVQSDSAVNEHKCEIVDFMELNNHRQPQLTMVSAENMNFSIVNSENSSVEEVEQKFTPAGNIELVSNFSLVEVGKHHSEFNGERTHEPNNIQNDLAPQSPPQNVPQTSVANNEVATRPDLSDMKFVVNVSKKPVKTYGKTAQANKTEEEDLEGTEPTLQAVLNVDSRSNEKSPTKLLTLGPITVSKPDRITWETIVSKPNRFKLPRKRRLVIDANKQIPVKEFQNQLKSTRDITLIGGDLAPASKKAMKCLEVGGVARFFSSPGRPIRNVPLSRLYSNHLVMVTEAINGPRDYSDLVPLTSDLRIERIGEDGCSSKETADIEIIQHMNTVRLVNIGKPGTSSLQSMFKGLNRPPTYRRYKPVKRKSALGASLVKNKILRDEANRQTPQDCNTTTTLDCGEDTIHIIKTESCEIGENGEVIYTHEKSPSPISMNSNSDSNLVLVNICENQDQKIYQPNTKVDSEEMPPSDPLKNVQEREQFESTVHYILGNGLGDEVEEIKKEENVVNTHFYVDSQVDFEGSIVEPCDVQSGDLGTLQVEVSPS